MWKQYNFVSLFSWNYLSTTKFWTCLFIYFDWSCFCFATLVVLVYYQFQFQSTLEFNSLFVLPFAHLFSNNYLSSQSCRIIFSLSILIFFIFKLEILLDGFNILGSISFNENWGKTSVSPSWINLVSLSSNLTIFWIWSVRFGFQNIDLGLTK